MQKIRYRLVYNRAKKLNNQGKALVQCECNLDGRRIYASTRVYLKPGEWDYEFGQVSDFHPNHKELNAFLFEFIYNLEKVELDVWKRGSVPTLQLLKDAIKGDRVGKITFEVFALQIIEQSDRKQGSKNNLINTLKMIKKFKPAYDWDDLNYNFLTELEIYLRGQCKSVNTIAKHLTQLRTLVNEAIRQGYLTLNPFARFRIRHKDGSHSFLNPDELALLENTSLSDKRLQHTLDAFLFCCYVGLRFSDFKSLRSDNFIMKEEKVWLSLDSQKTEVKLELPFYLLGGGKADGIMNKYRNLKEFTSIGCNADVNRKLRQIMNMVGIKKRITFHSSRHTCATSLVYDGVPITSVQRVLGHKKIATTQIYSEVHNQTLVKDLSKAFRGRMICNNKFK